jgi:hypothetical protein
VLRQQQTAAERTKEGMFLIRGRAQQIVGRERRERVS